MFKRKESELNEDLSNTTETPKVQVTPSICMEDKPKWSKKKIAILYVAILVVGTTCSYIGTNIYLDKKIAEKKNEISKQVEENDTKAKSEVTVNPQSTGITVEDTQKAKSITVTTDNLPQELVTPKDGLPLKNRDGWFLVDTDGDLKGDSYWGISEADAEGSKFGKLYPFSTEKRRWIKVKIQEANKEKGIPEKWESRLDWSYEIKPQFLIPAQLCKEGLGTILEWKQLK